MIFYSNFLYFSASLGKHWYSMCPQKFIRWSWVCVNRYSERQTVLRGVNEILTASCTFIVLLWLHLVGEVCRSYCCWAFVSSLRIGRRKAVLFVDINEVIFTREPWNLYHSESKERLVEVCILNYGVHHWQPCLYSQYFCSRSVFV